MTGLAAAAIVLAALATEPPGHAGHPRSACAVCAIRPPPAADTGRPPAADAWLGSDKFVHVGMSWASALFTYAGLRLVGADADTGLTIALPMAGAAGVGKELYDRQRGGRFSVRDLVADAVGVGAAYFLLREVR